MVNDNLIFHHPKVGDIVEMGESDYFTTVYTLAAIPSDMKSQLWDAGICWEDIDDFDFFYLLTRSLSVEKTKIFFGDLDFSKFIIAVNEQNGEKVMYQKYKRKEICIDLLAYLKIVEAIRKIHNIVPKVEKAATNTVRRILIEEDRMKLRRIKDVPAKSQMVPLISSLLNCSEFKYDLEGIRKLPVYAFFDSVNRIQIIKSATALLQGCYSGMIDTSKINKKELNWMRDIKEG